jgi:hypothetical protein
MTPSIALLGLSAQVVILLALVAAVASPRASQLARAMSATFAFTCAWLLTAVLGGLRAPGWTMLTGGAVIVVSIGVITVTVHVWTQEAGPESGPGRRGNGGGGGPPGRRPDTPQSGDCGQEPSWWPEFERQVAFYVGERERERQRSAVLLTGQAPCATRHRSCSDPCCRA